MIIQIHTQRLTSVVLSSTASIEPNSVLTNTNDRRVYDRHNFSSCSINYTMKTTTASSDITKLAKSLDMLSALEKRHQHLLRELEELTEKYRYTKLCGMDAVWRYAPQASRDIQHIPSADKTIIETDDKIGDYLLGEKLGEGQNSVVKKSILNGKPVAVKIIAKDRVRSIEGLLRIEQELAALKSLSPHPNIIAFQEVKHLQNNLYIVTEYFPMDLFGFMDIYKAEVDDNISSVIVGELMAALQHMAVHRIAHRDLKPENILIALTTRSMRMKLCDFGLSRTYTSESTHLSDFCGSPGFFAPEVYLDKSYDGVKTDIFSAGCIALEMLVSQKFFKERWIAVYSLAKQRREADFTSQIKYAIDGARSELARVYHPEIGSCVSEMLEFYPGKRANLLILLQKPWITEANVLDAVAKLNGKPCSPPTFGKLLFAGQVVKPYNKKTKNDHKLDDSLKDTDAGVLDTVHQAVVHGTLARLMPKTASELSKTSEDGSSDDQTDSEGNDSPLASIDYSSVPHQFLPSKESERKKSISSNSKSSKVGLAHGGRRSLPKITPPS